MLAPDDTTAGGPVNYQNQCPHCSAITVIPADEDFSYEDDYCASCGQSFYTSPEEEPAAPVTTAEKIEQLMATASELSAQIGDDTSAEEFMAISAKITPITRQIRELVEEMAR